MSKKDNTKRGEIIETTVNGDWVRHLYISPLDENGERYKKVTMRTKDMSMFLSETYLIKKDGTEVKIRTIRS